MIVKPLVIDQTDDQVVDNRHMTIIELVFWFVKMSFRLVGGCLQQAAFHPQP